MIKLIELELEQILSNIKAGNSNLSEEDLIKLIETIRQLSSPYLNATESSIRLGVCRKTFDNYVNRGYLPKGKVIQGYREKVWLKYDIDKWKLENKMKN